MEQPTGIRIGYACFDLGDGLHITIGRHYDAAVETLGRMQEFVDQKLKPLLPFHIAFGNYTLVGENFDVPAYKVKFMYEGQRKVVEEFYKLFYNEQPGKRLWNLPKFHVTCDTPGKLKYIESWIRQSRQDTSCILRDLHFRSRVEGGPAEISTDGDWKCPICLRLNSPDFKVCATDGCDQWRPKELAPVAAFKPGDWTCSCGFGNFASRDMCKNCNRPRNFLEPSDAQDAYAAPPASAPPSAVIGNSNWMCTHCQLSNPEQARVCLRCVLPRNLAQKKPDHAQAFGGGKRPDWWCQKCQFKVFGSKERCGKCQTRRP
jgi:hypothetical protein